MLGFSIEEHQFPCLPQFYSADLKLSESPGIGSVTQHLYCFGCKNSKWYANATIATGISLIFNKISITNIMDSTVRFNETQYTKQTLWQIKYPYNTMGNDPTVHLFYNVLMACHNLASDWSPFKMTMITERFEFDVAHTTVHLLQVVLGNYTHTLYTKSLQ